MKKPIVVEACQFDGDPDSELELWLGDAFESWIPSEAKLVFHTLTGEVTVQEGTWVIKGYLDGDFYPCDPLTFEHGFNDVPE